MLLDLRFVLLLVVAEFEQELKEGILELPAIPYHDGTLVFHKLLQHVNKLNFNFVGP